MIEVPALLLPLLLAGGLLAGLYLSRIRRAAPAPPAPPQRYDMDELVRAVNRGVSLLDVISNRCGRCGKPFRVQTYFTTSTGRYVENETYWRNTTCQCAAA